MRARTYPLARIKKCIMVAMACDIPIMVWGAPGVGKSSMMRQLAVEMGMQLFDVRGSDKEPTDLGGIPDKVIGEDGEAYLQWLVGNDLIPFVRPGRENLACILFQDELDRSPMEVQNVQLQLTLDRQVNGHKLVDGCRVVAAGNGTSDNGTTPMTAALATRLVHLYVDTTSPEAVDGFEEWAEKNEVSPSLIGFSRWRQSVFTGEQAEFAELQRPTPRTFVYADKLVNTCEQLPWGDECIEPLVYGAVGVEAGTEFNGYRRLAAKAPRPSEIIADPKGCAVPDDPSILWAVAQELSNYAHTGTTEVDGKEVPTDNPDKVKAFVEYVSRWPEEQQAHWFRNGARLCPSIITTEEYAKWQKTFRTV